MLVWPDSCDRGTIEAIAEGIFMTRDMISTPAEDLGPQHIAEEACALAAANDVASTVIVGEDLLAQNYPAIHTVGRAAAASNAPRLVDFK
jgi:leucyl aminopeptidase